MNQNHSLDLKERNKDGFFVEKENEHSNKFYTNLKDNASVVEHENSTCCPSEMNNLKFNGDEKVPQKEAYCHSGTFTDCSHINLKFKVKKVIKAEEKRIVALLKKGDYTKSINIDNSVKLPRDSLLKDTMIGRRIKKSGVAKRINKYWTSQNTPFPSIFKKNVLNKDNNSVTEIQDLFKDLSSIYISSVHLYRPKNSL